MIRDPQTKEDDEVLAFAFEKLESVFYENGNGVLILLALSDIEPSGGFANDFCVFLSNLKKSTQYNDFKIKFEKKESVLRLKCKGITE